MNVFLFSWSVGADLVAPLGRLIGRVLGGLERDAQLAVSLPALAVCFGLSIVTGRWIMRRLNGVVREVALAFLNLAGVWYFLIYPHNLHTVPMLAVYLTLVMVQYAVFRLFSGAKGWLPWLAFFTPITALLVYRYAPDGFFMALGHLIEGHLRGSRPLLIGMSYLTFRCSRLVLEVRNGTVKAPGFWEYLNFAFFLPTMSVGPINTYANFRRGFDGAPWEVPVGRAILRVLVGLVKYQVLGGYFSQLTYGGLMLNGHLHPWVHLPVAMVFYSLFLYCNFSGVCDLAIGAAGLMGIPVLENFDNPFAARNMKEFWNRWHITLSQWMREIVFAPLSKFLVRVMGPAWVNHAIALTILSVFLLIGIWHGVGWNYVVFGVLQALGVIANHYYTLGLKQWLGREGFKAYNSNPWIHAAAVVLTFGYWSASLLFFANSLPQIKEIFQTLR